jgi:hypothetical protein
LAALSLLSLFTACGGKSSGSAGTAKPNSNPSTNPLENVPEGYWQGTLTGRGGIAHKATCLVLASGEARLMVKNQFLISFSLGKGNSEGQFMALGLNTFKPGGADKKAAFITVTNIQQQRSFSGHYTVQNKKSSQFDDKGSFTFDTYGTEYDKTIEYSVLAGNYGGSWEIHKTETLERPRKVSFRHYKDVPIVLAADGTLSGGNVEAFHIQGTYSIPSKDKAGIQLSFTYTPADGKGIVEQFQGLGVVSSDQGKHMFLITALSEHNGLIVGCFTSNEAAPTGSEL